MLLLLIYSNWKVNYITGKSGKEAASQQLSLAGDYPHLCSTLQSDTVCTQSVSEMEAKISRLSSKIGRFCSPQDENWRLVGNHQSL